MKFSDVYFSVIEIFGKILSLLGNKRKPKILIDCIEVFHYLHIKPVVDLLLKESKLKVYVLDNTTFNRTSIKQELVSPHLFVSAKIAKFIKFDLTITMEYQGGAWIPHRGIQLFTPHGDGMKITYAGDKRLEKYDIVWALGKEQEKIQLPCLKDGAIIEKIGFIATDQLTNGTAKHLDDENNKESTTRKPVILYAPSWSNLPEAIIMSEPIIEKLAKQKEYKVYIKPHPYLLQAERCGGKNWKAIIQKFEHENFTLIHKPDDFIYRYMLAADLLLSDISSVIFEYLFLDRPVVVHVNISAIDHYQGGERFEQLKNIVHFCTHEEQLMETIKMAIHTPHALSRKRKELLNDLYYNPGSAAKAGVASIYKALSLS